jgi:lipopolysaccharide/colanic/teichoic acid biosynthesis glycosyltransferase
VKKNLAAYRYLDEKVIPLYLSEASLRSIDESFSEAGTLDHSLKRMFDIVFSTVVLLFGFPFYLLIAAFIKLTSPGPVLFVQDRVGQNSKPFRMFKR